MARLTLILLFAALMAKAPALDLDLPGGVTLQFGFNVQVVPSSKDTSRQLGLVVTPERAITDKKRTLVVTGTIINYASVPYSGLDLRFAVTGYTEIGTSFGHASVNPNYIPPGGSARFEAYINLNQEKPHRAAYTLTAHAANMVYQTTPPAVVYATPSVTAPTVTYTTPSVIYATPTATAPTVTYSTPTLVDGQIVYYPEVLPSGN